MQSLDDSDAQDDWVGLNLDDSSKHVDCPRAGSVHRSVVLGNSSETEECVGDGTSDLLTKLPTVGLGVCTLIEFAP